MTVNPRRRVLELPEPRSVSEGARHSLRVMNELVIGDADEPQTVEAWEHQISFSDEMLRSIISPPGPDTTSVLVSPADVPAYDVVPPDVCTDHICLYLHGGAFIMGGGPVAEAMTAAFAEGARIRSIGVDYRRPPRHPYPAPLDDCVDVYRTLLDDHDPGRIVVAGASAGGNLAAALVLRARADGLPLPGAVVLLSPEVDLTESGDSFHTLLGIDPVLRSSLEPSILLYAGGHDLTDPHLSPLFGDFASGFPPTFLQTGTRDFFLSNTVLFHRALRRCDVEAELHVWDAMPHGGFGAMLEGGIGQVPEDQEIYEELRKFLTKFGPADKAAV